MGKRTATALEWARYYEAADKRRSAGDGDPFTKHVRREVARERWLLAGSAAVMTALLAAFYVLLQR